MLINSVDSSSTLLRFAFYNSKTRCWKRKRERSEEKKLIWRSNPNKLEQVLVLLGYNGFDKSATKWGQINLYASVRFTRHTKTCQRSLIMSINFHILHYTQTRVRINSYVCLFLLKIELAQTINWTRARTPKKCRKSEQTKRNQIK